jgi:hypothetical protein
MPPNSGFQNAGIVSAATDTNMGAAAHQATVVSVDALVGLCSLLLLDQLILEPQEGELEEEAVAAAVEEAEEEKLLANFSCHLGAAGLGIAVALLMHRPMPRQV